MVPPKCALKSSMAVVTRDEFSWAGIDTWAWVINSSLAAEKPSSTRASH